MTSDNQSKPDAELSTSELDQKLADEFSPKVFNKKEKRLFLTEMLGPTIQGEGAVIGQQTYFLRFGLCDYKCKMCDSMHAVDPHQVAKNSERLTQKEIFDKFIAFYKPNSTKNITFSGGNPCMHDLTELVALLNEAGFYIIVETQGTFHPEWLKDCEIVTVSPKGPGMGEVLILEQLDEFMEDVSQHGNVNMKVVAFDQRDLEMAAMLIERYEQLGQLDADQDFYLSLGNSNPPGMDELKGHLYHMHNLTQKYTLLFDEIKLHPTLSRVKFLPQWHVFVWGNEKGK